jgi:prepilin-type N-terminal cleavage/methylation domain-containing protein
MKEYTKKKLKGFTILELLVVMALSTLVLSFAYTSLRHVQKLFIGYKQQSAFISAATTFKDRLKRDFVFSDMIWELEPGHFKIESNKTVKELVFSNKTLVLTYEENSDSLLVDHIMAEVNYKNFDAETGFNKLVERIKISFIYKEEEFSLNLKKDYPADIIINLIEGKDAKY